MSKEIGKVIESIVEEQPFAIRADPEAVENGVISLTVYTCNKSITEMLSEIGEVVVTGIAVEFCFEIKPDSPDVLDDILLFLRADLEHELADGTEITGCDVDNGLDNLRSAFQSAADERAVELANESLAYCCEPADRRLLLECRKHAEFSRIFWSPHGDTSIEIYDIGGARYALYSDGGKEEAFRCDTLAPTLTDKLEESGLWR